MVLHRGVLEMAKILVEYDTVSKEISVDNAGTLSGPLDSISFSYHGKDEDGKMKYGCEMASFSKDKENDTYKMERMYCSQNQEALVTAARELLSKI